MVQACIKFAPRAGLLLAIGYWLLAIGYWLLAIGYWLLAIGYRLLAIGYSRSAPVSFATFPRSTVYCR
jgi:hypothetical protein